MANSWADLHEDLLETITRGLSIEDFLTFGSICSSWNSAAERRGYDTKMTIPWLMLPTKEETGRRGFYNLSSRKIHDALLPETTGKRCLSSLGWIMTIDRDWKVDILNPFRGNRDKIELPSLHDFPRIMMRFVFEAFIRKFVLSSSPSSNDYTVMVLRDTKSEFSFWKPGDSHWTNIEWDGPMNWDLIFYYGRFVAINAQGQIIACDIEGPDPPRASVVLEMPNMMLRNYFFNKRLYLVESEGTLLLVSREARQPCDEEEDIENDDADEDPRSEVDEDDSENFGTDDDDGECLETDYSEDSGTEEEEEEEEAEEEEEEEGKDDDDNYDDALTEGFQVFKVDIKDKKWTELKDLGDTSLFIGHNSSFSVRVPNNSLGINPNCVYFTDDFDIGYLLTKKGGGKDMGFYRMEDGVIKKHFNGESYCRLSPPLWLEPEF